MSRASCVSKWSFVHEQKHPLLVCEAPFAEVAGAHAHTDGAAYAHVCLPLTCLSLSPCTGPGPQAGKIGDYCSRYFGFQYSKSMASGKGLC